MRLRRKRVSVGEIAGDAETALRDLLIEQPKAWLKGARERMRDLPKANFDLGCRFADQGKWLDALFRFKVTIFLQPEYPKVWYNLGCCYFRRGNIPKAKEALRKALAQKSNDPDALFMLAAIDPASVPANQRPERMPREMVTGFFGSIAKGYDIAESQAQYQGGKATYELVKPFVKEPNPVVVDLACGTGIAARPWRVTAKEIVGVELTPGMVALAQRATHADKKLFDQLITADIAQLPATMSANQADVVLLINAVQFVGELSGVMQGAARIMKPGAVLVMTAEQHSSATGFGLSQETGRFGHSPAYVRQVAQAAGFALTKEANLALYPEIPLQTFVFTKGSN